MAVSNDSRRSFSSEYLRTLRSSPPPLPERMVSTEPVRVPSGAKVKEPLRSLGLASGGSTGKAMIWLAAPAESVPELP
jgi:hypothetical protein